MKLLGIDDAGRGPVIGPMILSGVLIEKSQEQEIKSLGAKDSKLLTPKTRNHIKNQITKTYPHKIISTSPKEIDSSKNLNTLEAQKTAQIINHFLSGSKEKIQIIVDCPSVNLEAWSNEVKKILTNDYKLPATSYQLSCEHKADFNHPVVAAASILAKERREEEIKKIKDNIKIDFGSGYPADPKTKEFLEKNFNKEKYSEIIRFSWNTVKKLFKQKDSGQQKLF